jgi:hypothetical protein
MADWAIAWVAPLSDEELAKVQMTEHGGMNEVLFNLVCGDRGKEISGCGIAL